MVTTVTIRVTAVTAAPAYMSRTAVFTVRGGAGRAGRADGVGPGGFSSPCGDGWYMSAPHGPGEHAERMARGNSGGSALSLAGRPPLGQTLRDQVLRWAAAAAPRRPF